MTRSKDALKSRNSSWISAIPEIIKKYVDTGKVRLVFKVVPLHGQIALDAGNAALCAGEQGKFWEYHDLLFSNQSKWYVADATASAKLVKSYSKDVGIDVSKFNQCYDAQTYSAEVMQNYSEFQAVFGMLQEAGLVEGDQQGLGTPSYFINGRYIAGAQSFPAFEKIIEEELSK